MKSIEKYLVGNNFSLDTYYGENKRYVKEINSCQNLYVRIYSDCNKIVDVEYEDFDPTMTYFQDTKTISLHKVDTLSRLKILLKAIL